MKSVAVLLSLFPIAFLPAAEGEYITKENLPYYPEEVRAKDEYIAERCVLDVYHPKDKKGFATVVWFHGGGLKAGKKKIPEGLKEQGLAVVAANYRLHPKVKAPGYIEDAAAAVAWTLKNIGSYGGRPDLVFVAGHSAGGYLTSMVGLDKRWLAAHGLHADRIAGLIPLSGHTITHFTVRKERGIDGKQPVVDDLAPLFHVRASAPPVLLVTGDREKEMLGRYEENAYLARMMKVAGHEETQLVELKGHGHGIAEPAMPLLLKEVKRVAQERSTSYYDIEGVKPDLVTPPAIVAEPAPGKRVRQYHPEYKEGGDIYHLLHLPADWEPGKKYPVIVEYSGNQWKTSLGSVEEDDLGYGITGGEGAIWICMPFVDTKNERNAPKWWGDVDASVEYCIDTVRRVCRDFGGDPDKVYVAGFSRGSIACNYIGLHDERIASLWRGFICHSHYDGVRTNWGYDGADRKSAGERLARLRGRPQFISQERTANAARDYLAVAAPEGNFTFLDAKFGAHTDTFVLRNVPERKILRHWFAESLKPDKSPMTNERAITLATRFIVHEQPEMNIWTKPPAISYLADAPAQGGGELWIVGFPVPAKKGPDGRLVGVRPFFTCTVWVKADGSTSGGFTHSP